MREIQCSDICDEVFAKMCTFCPNVEKCQNKDDEMNHEQMLSCLHELFAFIPKEKYPTETEFTPLEHVCCVCGKPAEGKDVCDCKCPHCQENCFDDVTIADHGMCYDCFQTQRNREDAKSEDEE